jgi:hypothetical protein
MALQVVTTRLAHDISLRFGNYSASLAVSL